jgi:mRNA deadenylase 3'-5' endonuclease subunit Ccr4
MLDTLTLCTYNILAPCWTNPGIYPTSSVPYLDRYVRRDIKIDILNNLAKTHDIIALQEIQDDEYPVLKEAMKQIGFQGFNVNHRDDYWENYITLDPPFVSNGVGLFWNKKNINILEIQGHNFSDDGNKGIVAYFRKNNKLFRVTCVHLDTKRGGRVTNEAQSIVDLLVPGEDLTDIIIGDLNFNTGQEVYDVFKDSNFIDVYDAVGEKGVERPLNTSYAGNTNCGIIDHIMIRNATPVSSSILDFNAWSDGSQDPEERINLTLQRIGSDHFIVIGKIEF